MLDSDADSEVRSPKASFFFRKMPRGELVSDADSSDIAPFAPEHASETILSSSSCLGGWMPRTPRMTF